MERVDDERTNVPRKRRHSKARIAFGVFAVLLLTSVSAFFWFQPLGEYIAALLSPPNYEAIVSVRPSDGAKVTPAMLTIARRNFARRLSAMEASHIIISYRIAEQPPSRLVVGMRFPSDPTNPDLVRPHYMTKRLTLNIVKNNSDELVKDGMNPDGFQLLHAAGAEDTRFIVSKNPIGEDAIEDAEAVVDASGDGFFAISVKLTDEARRSLNEELAKAGQLQIAIVLEGEVIATPIIREAITADTVRIGHFTAQQAGDLAILLRAGGVPWPLYLERGRFLK